MKVILREDVRKLGKKNEVVEVSDGYARNFLFSRGLAEEATAQNVNILKDKTAAAERKDAKFTAEAEATKARISGKVVRVRVSCGEGGRLFGSVTAAQAADALKEQYGVELDKKYTGVECPMTLSVEAE